MDSTTCSSSDTCAAAVGGNSSLSSLDLVIYGTSGLVAMGLSTIIALQLDAVSRLFLSPKSLLAKRRREYKYALEQGNEYTALMIRQHVGGGKGLYLPKTESIVWEKIGKSDSEGMAELISGMLDSEKATPVIVAIEQDIEDDINPNEYYLFLAFPPESKSAGGVSTPVAATVYRRVRVPLISFCDKLAEAFKRQMTSTALCFIADASCGLGTDMLTGVVKDCDHGVVSLLLHLLMFCGDATLVCSFSNIISISLGYNSKSCLDDNFGPNFIEQYSKHHHVTIRNYYLCSLPSGCISCERICWCKSHRSFCIARTIMCSTAAPIGSKGLCS